MGFAFVFVVADLVIKSTLNMWKAQEGQDQKKLAQAQYENVVRTQRTYMTIHEKYPPRALLTVRWKSLVSKDKLKHALREIADYLSLWEFMDVDQRSTFLNRVKDHILNSSNKAPKPGHAMSNPDAFISRELSDIIQKYPQFSS